MTHSLREKVNVFKLRKNEKSYSEIYKATNISKSTLSDWLAEKDWSIKIKSKLTDESLKNNKQNIVAAIKVIKAKKKSRHSRFKKEALAQYLKFKNDPLFTFSLGLYWGEGDKKSGESVAVTNTDPNMLRIISLFYRKYLNVDESKLRIALFLYKDINKDFAIDFWSQLLNVPRSQFIKIQILESRAKRTKTKSKYEICCLYFSNTEFHIKILEWIRLLCLEMRV